MRTLDSRVDLRWGPEGKGFRRLVHPNGICLTGRWTIDADTPYTGYFAKGSSALVVGRYSTCCTETKRGQTRSLSLVGKLFPTTDPYHLQPLPTANFFTQEDIGGAKTEFINDAELRNAPDMTLGQPRRRRRAAADHRRASCSATSISSRRCGSSIRSRSSASRRARRRAPRSSCGCSWRRSSRGFPATDLDFRDEVMAQIFDKGDPFPKRTLTFTIELTDDGETSGSASRERRTFRNWRKVGHDRVRQRRRVAQRRLR